jgi:hypothetical protein
VKVERFESRFVEHFPERLQPGVLYVSMEFASVAHLCACGCGNQVITPLSPARWRLSFDGEGIWLNPSIGNWSFPCRSHYWIERSQVRWSYEMSEKEIDGGRRRAQAVRSDYYGEMRQPAVLEEEEPVPDVELPQPGWWARLHRRFKRG